MQGLPLYFVGVRCPIEVINERESSRLGRFPGTATSHFHEVHAHGSSYDLEVDTDEASPNEIAGTILSALGPG